MNISNPYRFGVPAPAPSSANTFIGGLAADYPTATSLATRFRNYPSGSIFSENDIQGFKITGGDIECTIEVPYSLAANSFTNNKNITTYIDKENYCKELLNSNFDGANNLEKTQLNGVISTTGPCFRNTFNMKHFSFLNLTTMGGSLQFFSGVSGGVFYAPNLSPIGETAAGNGVFTNSSGFKLYCNPSNQTNNGGNPDGDITALISLSGSVSYIANYTAPNSITNLSVGAVNGTSLQLNFTAPTGSANAIDFYEVFIDGIYNNTIQGSGGYAINLALNTSYSIEVKPVDIYYNKASSNIVAQSTSATYTIPSANIFSYYKMQNNVLDSSGTNNGTATAITYEAGTVGQRAVFNGATSKVQLSQLPVSAEMSLVVRVKLTNHTPSAAKSGFMSLNTENADTHYPYSDGNIYMSLLTSVRKTIGSGIIADRTKEHIIFVTANTNTNVWKFYQNSKLVHTSTVGTLIMNALAILGKSKGNYFFDGSQDEVAFLNIELLDHHRSEIVAKLNAGQSLI